MLWPSWQIVRQGLGLDMGSERAKEKKENPTL